MEQTINLIVVFNFFLLIILIVGIFWWQKRHSKLSEKRLILILLGYFSYSFISPLVPEFLINPGLTTLIIIGFLLVLWGLGYPFFRWVFKQFNQPK
jgi:hypothetical protein